MYPFIKPVIKQQKPNLADFIPFVPNPKKVEVKFPIPIPIAFPL